MTRKETKVRLFAGVMTASVIVTVSCGVANNGDGDYQVSDPITASTSTDSTNQDNESKATETPLYNFEDEVDSSFRNLANIDSDNTEISTNETDSQNSSSDQNLIKVLLKDSIEETFNQDYIKLDAKGDNTSDPFSATIAASPKGCYTQDFAGDDYLLTVKGRNDTGNSYLLLDDNFKEYLNNASLDKPSSPVEGNIKDYGEVYDFIKSAKEITPNNIGKWILVDEGILDGMIPDLNCQIIKSVNPEDLTSINNLSKKENDKEIIITAKESNQQMTFIIDKDEMLLTNYSMKANGSDFVSSITISHNVEEIEKLISEPTKDELITLDS